MRLNFKPVSVAAGFTDIRREFFSGTGIWNWASSSKYLPLQYLSKQGI
jgi:hypothetical protein